MTRVAFLLIFYSVVMVQYLLHISIYRQMRSDMRSKKFGEEFCPGFSQSEEISSDLCCFYGGGISHNEDAFF